MANEPIAFAAVLAGGWLLDRGVKDLKTAFSSSSSGAGGAKTAGTGTATGGYSNPFPGGWTPGRLDMGYDGTFTGKLVAPVSGVITYASSSFSNWGGYVEIKADKPIPGLPSDTFYFAEGLAPTVKAGQRVQAGQQIAIPSATGGAAQGVGAGTIEWGLANPGSVGSPSDPLAKSIAGATAMVTTFAKWAERILGIAAPTDTSHAGYA